MKNKILVIMPVYNTEKFVENAIQGIIQQSYTNWELVMVDDNSTDDSLQILQKYAEQYDNITAISNTENRGSYFCRNKGLTFLDDSFDFYTVHDSDDISDIDRFQIFIDTFNEDEDLLGLKSTYMRVREDLQPDLRGRSQPNIYACEGHAWFRKEVFDILGFYDGVRHTGDTEYWWRLERYCQVNPTKHVEDQEDILYLAINRDDNSNLTKQYTIGGSERQAYYNKIRNEISQLNTTEDFYRESFK